ncbi:hypothetical protein OAO18_05500 [Francisellaceae bacterium]|nr:hypothetical protein [Francisellaceae bacterium]
MLYEISNYNAYTKSPITIIKQASSSPGKQLWKFDIPFESSQLMQILSASVIPVTDEKTNNQETSVLVISGVYNGTLFGSEATGRSNTFIYAVNINNGQKLWQKVISTGPNYNLNSVIELLEVSINKNNEEYKVYVKVRSSYGINTGKQILRTVDDDVITIEYDLDGRSMQIIKKEANK